MDPLFSSNQLPHHGSVGCYLKAIRIEQPGPPGVMQYVDLPTPTPGPGEVLIRSQTIGVGIPDMLIRSGVYPWMPPLPTIVGVEVCGTVEAVGPGVQSLRPGQLVAAYRNGGCYAEYVAVHQRHVFPMPEGTDPDKAVMLPIVYQTAYHLLHTVARVSEGQTALVYAAAGGVGTALVQLGRLAGLIVIGTASSDEKAQFARTQGADYIVNYRTESVAERVLAATGGKGADVIFTPTASDALAENLHFLAHLGQVVLYSMLDGWPTAYPIPLSREMFARSPALRLFSMHVFDGRPEVWAQTVSKLVGLLTAGSIQPRVFQRLPLAEAARAHELLERRATMGKILLNP